MAEQSHINAPESLIASGYTHAHLGGSLRNKRANDVGGDARHERFACAGVEKKLERLNLARRHGLAILERDSRRGERGDVLHDGLVAYELCAREAEADARFS